MENHAGRWQAAGASGPFRQLSCFEESHTEAWLSSARLLLVALGFTAGQAFSLGAACGLLLSQGKGSRARRDLAAPRHVGSSWIRDQTRVSCIEQVNSSPRSHQGSPPLPGFRVGVRPSEDVHTHCHLGTPTQEMRKNMGHSVSRAPQQES